MTRVFLFGTLRYAPLLQVVAGATLPARAARLRGHRVAQVQGEDWPVLLSHVDTTAEAEGLLIDVEAPVLARLDFYEACFGYARQALSVLTPEGPVAAEVWRPEDQTGAHPPAGPEDWSLDRWSEAWGPVSVLAAEEVMRQTDTATPSEIAQRFGMIRSRAQATVATRRWRRSTRIGSVRSDDDVRIARRDHVYDGFQTMEVLHAQFRKFDGQWSDPVERAVARVSDAVTVLPYDPVRDRVLLVEQVRFGPLGNGDVSPWLLEPVAGMIDAGETAEIAARRETREEAGIDLGALHFVARYYPSPGGIAQVIFSYVAEATLPDEVTGVGGSDDENEDIKSYVVPYDDAVAACRDGEMANAPLLISFQWLMLNRERLRGAA